MSRFDLRTIAAVVIACVSPASAQTVMDGSDANISPREKAALYDALRSNLTDPFGSQVMGLAQGAGDNICGAVNAKNRMGGFVGFRPFAVDPQTHSFTTLPDLENFDITHPEAEKKLELAKLAIVILKEACGSQPK